MGVRRSITHGVNPSGGPYVGLGTKIDGKEIVKISSLEDTFIVEVKKD